MLSKQFDPKTSDIADPDQILPLRRNRTSRYNDGPQLTINDLQKLDELAEEASQSDDPTRLRSILRRSLSMNVAPSAIDTMDNMPDTGEDADAPIIIPRPGQILRRAARTKIRKPGLPGDGGGHRFGASTRRSATTGAQAPTTLTQRTSSDVSSSEHSEGHLPSRKRTFSGESLSEEPESIRPESYSEDASFIFDSYIDALDNLDDDESKAAASSPDSGLVTSPPEAISIELPVSPPIPTINTPSDSLPSVIPPAPPSPVIHQPQPQRVANLRPPTSDVAARGSSPDSLRSAEGTNSRSHSPASDSSHASPNGRKEKDKKSLFGFGSKGAKKTSNKEKEQRAESEREEEKKREKEKESGFFGSLFGGKKKQEDGAQAGHSTGTTVSSVAAGKNARSLVSPVSPQFAGIGGSYARYPIHVERAIYRLSHIKLANPRRPLYEQVLISNLMFWYLGVINKTQAPTTPPATQGQQQQGNQAGSWDREQKETEDRHRAEKERAEKEKEREREREQKKETSRRGPLTKSAPGRRAAEMPVRGPQYEMQTRAIDQEYGGFGSSSPPTVRSAASNSSGTPTSRQQQQHLPPGAMPPANSDQMNWLASPPASSPSKARRPTSPPSPPPGAARRSRSPPPHNHNRFAPSPIHQPDLYMNQAPGTGPNIPPSRSRSATAGAPATQPSAMVNGKLRKNSSAQAVMVPNNSNGRKPRRSDTTPANPSGEEEDLPLAMWQQQHQQNRR
ncbi:hypothetical protein HWV62_27765 [Athelia sp. TMB]|nr:hypothetical protein HWV62_27765 [Athelia sp. TMB]